MLTIVTSTTFSVHGMALLLVIRACYNIYIMSRSETNQVTAKAALTQMVNVVFQRLAAGDVVQVRLILTNHPYESEVSTSSFPEMIVPINFWPVGHCQGRVN